MSFFDALGVAGEFFSGACCDLDIGDSVGGVCAVAGGEYPVLVDEASAAFEVFVANIKAYLYNVFGVATVAGDNAAVAGRGGCC